MELRMLSGLHRGAMLEMDEEAGTALTIGMSPDADVLLADPGVAKIHCKLAVQGKRWHIVPVEGSVFDRHGRAVTNATAIERGTTFRLGNVWIGFFAETDSWDDTVVDAAPATESAAASGAGAGRYPRAKASIVLALAAALALPAAWFVSTAWGRAAVHGTATQGKALESALPVVGADQPLSPAKLADEFVRGLAERELTDRLELQLGAEQWEIRGSLDPEEQQRFERLLLRFTETRKPGFPIRVTLVAPAELLPFKVIEVITGKGASVVTDGGERLQVGDTYQGWRLSAVESGKVVFLGKQRVEVAL